VSIFHFLVHQRVSSVVEGALRDVQVRALMYFLCKMIARLHVRCVEVSRVLFVQEVMVEVLREGSVLLPDVLIQWIA
jgi:hypothetical protein